MAINNQAAVSDRKPHEYIPISNTTSTLGRQKTPTTQPVESRAASASLFKLKSLLDGYHAPVIKKISEAQFKALIKTSRLPVLALISAEWCIPCHVLKEDLDIVIQRHKGPLIVVELDLDELTDEFKQKYAKGSDNRVSVPWLIFFKYKKIVDQLEGYYLPTDTKNRKLGVENIEKRLKRVLKK